MSCYTSSPTFSYSIAAYEFINSVMKVLHFYRTGRLQGLALSQTITVLMKSCAQPVCWCVVADQRR